MLKRLSCVTLCLIVCLCVGTTSVSSAENPSSEQVKQAMKKAIYFFKSIATNGGYVGLYSQDLQERYGEAKYEKATKDEIWVQPPGTPTVGETFLRAYKITGEQNYFDCAYAAGKALAWAQRKEGGWDHRCNVSHFVQASKPVKKSGHCTFDDNISQGALTFLMKLDEVVDESWLTESIDLALAHLMESQFDNGAWPQWYPLRGGYHDYYTFNDNTINDCLRVMLLAHKHYGREDCLASAKLCGDFFIASQIAAPQSGWAQQYSHDMKPAWARSFEPIGVCSAVTARNIRWLINLYLATNEEKYLEPITKAIAWLDRSTIGDNTWARFYELETNRPIYGDRDSKVHYDINEISEERRKGYGWQGGFGVQGAKNEYRKLQEMGADKLRAMREKKMTAAQRRQRLEGLMSNVAEVIETQDERGRWLDEDDMITCRLFNRNMNFLLQYLELQ